jgi:hypothetical protein
VYHVVDAALQHRLQQERKPEMSAAPRATREVPAEEPMHLLEIVDNSAMLYKKGVECMAEIQSRAVECAVQHNKETIALWKQLAEKLPWMPRANMFDNLAGTMDRVAEAQKTTIKLAVDQTRVFVDMVKERTAAARKTADAMSKFAQQSFEQSVAAQKKVTEATVAETRSAFENVRERFVVPGGEAVAESFRKSVDTILDAQKELLETASSRWAPEAETVSAA